MGNLPQGVKGIVFDMRGYPSVPALSILSNLADSTMSAGVIDRPYFYYHAASSGGGIGIG